MGINERTLGRTFERVVGDEQNDIVLMGIADRALVAFWEQIIPAVGGIERAHAVMEMIVAELGSRGVAATIYRHRNEDGAGLSAPVSPVRLHVDRRGDVDQVDTPYPPLKGKSEWREIYAPKAKTAEK